MTENEARIEFTVPKSGRRYRIHPDDWESIQLHMEIATKAREAHENGTLKNNPPVTDLTPQEF